MERLEFTSNILLFINSQLTGHGSEGKRSVFQQFRKASKRFLQISYKERKNFFFYNSANFSMFVKQKVYLPGNQLQLGKANTLHLVYCNCVVPE